MKELFWFIVGLAIGGVFHDEIPYIKDINTKKAKRHIDGLIDSVEM